MFIFPCAGQSVCSAVSAGTLTMLYRCTTDTCAGGGDHASRAGLHACSNDFARGAKSENAAVLAGNGSVGDKSASVGAENASLGGGQGREGLAVTGQIGIDVAENVFSLWHTSKHPIS